MFEWENEWINGVYKEEICYFGKNLSQRYFIAACSLAYLPFKTQDRQVEIELHIKADKNISVYNY